MSNETRDLLKKYRNGGLKAGTGPDAVKTQAAMNPAEGISNFQKIFALNKQAEARRNAAGAKPAQVNPGAKAGGAAQQNNPVLKSILDMVLDTGNQDAGVSPDHLGVKENLAAKINPVLKNIQDMVLNARQRKEGIVNPESGSGESREPHPVKENVPRDFVDGSVQAGLKDFTLPAGNGEVASIRAIKPTDVMYELIDSKLNIPRMVNCS